MGALILCERREHYERAGDPWNNSVFYKNSLQKSFLYNPILGKP